MKIWTQKKFTNYKASNFFFFFLQYIVTKWDRENLLNTDFYQGTSLLQPNNTHLLIHAPSHTFTYMHTHAHTCTNTEWNVVKKQKKTKNHLLITDVQTCVVDARESPHCWNQCFCAWVRISVTLKDRNKFLIPT